MAERTMTGNEVLWKSSILLPDGSVALKTQTNVAMGGIRSQIKQTHNLSTGDFTYTTSVGGDFILRNIRFKSDVPITQTITILIDMSGETFDVPILVHDLLDNKALSFTPFGDYYVYGATDSQITFTCTSFGLPNANVSLVIEVEVI